MHILGAKSGEKKIQVKIAFLGKESWKQIKGQRHLAVVMSQQPWVAGGREARQGRQSGSSLSLGSIDGPLGESAESNPGADAHLVTTVPKKTGKSWSLQANCKETAEFRSGRE